jgi:hypothetical protein
MSAEQWISIFAPSTMKKIRRILILVLTGFIAFAPPGTLVLGVALLLTLTGSVWFVVAGVLVVSVLAAVWLLYKSSTHKPNA